MDHVTHGLAATLIAASLTLSACGGGGGPSTVDGEGTTPPIPVPAPLPPSPPPHPLAKPLPAEAGVSQGGRQVGIGPAFANERPDINDFETRSRRGAFAVGSGRWGDPQGRDGSASAAEVVRFLRSFQTQNDREGGGDLVFVDFGAQKTLRIDSTARASERRATIAALRNINTSLPWRHRILLGPDISERLATEDIPEDEIHIHFTDGRGSWPELEEGEDYEPNVLGIGGSNFDREARRVLGGFSYIDRQAIGRDGARMEFVVTHELLHAWGMGAHVDPHAYPNVVLVPFVPRNLNKVPRFWLTVEGEALLAETILVPGTRVSDLTVADLGPWEDEGHRNRPVAAIACHQPITPNGPKDIFGKEISHDLIGRRHARGLIGTGPRSPRRGVPCTCVTTDKFLVAFDLETLQDLPDREQLEDAGLGAAQACAIATSGDTW